jgi:hypothetical protein
MLCAKRVKENRKKAAQKSTVAVKTCFMEISKWFSMIFSKINISSFIKNKYH